MKIKYYVWAGNLGTLYVMECFGLYDKKVADGRGHKILDHWKKGFQNYMTRTNGSRWEWNFIALDVKNYSKN